RFAACVNPDSVAWMPLPEARKALEDECETLIRQHQALTGSVFAAEILADWKRWRAHFVAVTPLEILKREQAQAHVA
ncbi:MAG: hypothetical protein AAGJ87_08940, partial [Pseudomonadota bacterium]